MNVATDGSSFVGTGAGLLTDVMLIRPAVHEDDRGGFRETFNQERIAAEHGIERHWPQDNHSWSHRNVLRGMHFQLGRPQGKLVSCVSGSIFDVAVDLRPESDTFGLWVGTDLSRANGCQLWVPEGFGHGFLVTSDGADVMYKVTELFVAGASRTLAFDDPTVGIVWPLDRRPILSDADAAGLSLAEVRSLLSDQR